MSMTKREIIEATAGKVTITNAGGATRLSWGEDDHLFLTDEELLAIIEYAAARKLCYNKRGPRATNAERKPRTKKTKADGAALGESARA